ncbi:MAG: DUF2099 family protein [Candidatus Helarchaeota archaeon]|nr:DUF2099 family protein [Candidatus Helarchaeota archaeon]
MSKKEKKEDKHVWEIGKGRVVISNGKVISVSEPLVKYCPIHEAWIGSKTHSVRTITRHTRWKIRDFGLCTPGRIIYAKVKGIGYGCSETFMSAMQHDLVDAVVVPCDGAGTVVTTTPEVTQGVGGPMNALVETSPIPELITRLRKKGAFILDPSSAPIDVLGGVKLAIEKGFKRIGAIVAGPEAAVIESIRKLEKENDIQIIIFVVHTTGVTLEDMKYIKQADMAHGCASKAMRDYFDTRAKKKFGSLIPAYAISEIGLKLLNIREEECLKKPTYIVVGDRPPPDLI